MKSFNINSNAWISYEKQEGNGKWGGKCIIEYDAKLILTIKYKGEDNDERYTTLTCNEVQIPSSSKLANLIWNKTLDLAMGASKNPNITSPSKREKTKKMWKSFKNQYNATIKHAKYSHTENKRVTKTTAVIIMEIPDF